MLKRRRPSIKIILLFIAFLMLGLPIGGIYFLRVYESALIRQTESELIAQAAFISALYKKEMETALKTHHIAITTYGLRAQQKHPFNESPQPILPRLDLARDFIYPARPLPLYTHDHLDKVSEEVGQRISPILTDAQRITLSGIKVLDYQGLVTAGQGEHGLSFVHTKEFQEASKGKPVRLLRRRRMPKTFASLHSISRNSNLNVFVALPIVLKDRFIGIVWVNRTPPDLSQALYGKRREITGLALILLLSAIAITLLTSYSITRPIRALVEKTRQITKNDPEGLEPLDNPVTAEITELSESMAQMAHTIKHRNEYLRNFAMHVSHEFKTPLTSMQGSIELLQDNLDEMSTEQKKKFLSNIADDTKRLNQLVSRLLELARADMTEPGAEYTSPLPLLQELVTRYQAKNLEIQLVLPAELQTIRVASENLEAIFGHLIENSLQASATQVKISASVEGDSIIFQVQDNGPGISKGNQENIFTPFFTTKRNTGGSGLGLSITQSLVENQGGSIVLVPQEIGTCFQIRFPVA